MADEPDDDELEAYLRSSLSDRRRSRWGRQSLRRGSSPFLTEAMAARRHSRRLSSFTTSSGDETAVSVEGEEESPEEVKENMRLNKQIIETIKLQPWRMKKKYKILRKAKAYVKKHEGELAQSKRSKDVFAKYTLLWTRGLNRFKRELANFMVMLTPWEMRIKRIESHFGSVVASYFTFLRWVFWINCFISAFVCCFLMVPEVLRGAKDPTGMRKEIESEEMDNALSLKNIWDFEGYLKYSPIFYGYYSNREMTEEGYRLPLAYFLTSLCVYIFSFFAILRRMAENSRMSKLSEKDDECTFAWKLFTGWDYMVGNPETAYNKVASLVMGFKEAILEEKEKKKEVKSWKLVSIRVAANFMVFLLLASSAYAVVLVVTRSQEPEAQEGGTWYRQNEVTIVVSCISLLFPNLFDMIGMAERYHPRVQLRWQLARILILYLLNLYTLIFALFDKVNKTIDELNVLAKNITDTVDSENSTLRRTRSLLGLNDVDAFINEPTETTTFGAPLNCTLVVLHNCTLAALFLGLRNTTGYSTINSTTVVDGDYFLDNATSDATWKEEEEQYGSMAGSIANLTAHGVQGWNGTSRRRYLPPLFLNTTQAMELGDGRMVWDIPIEYDPSTAAENDTFNDTSYYFYSTLDTGWTTDNETSSSDSTTTTEGDLSTTEEEAELNCTVLVPICTPYDTTLDPDGYTSTTEGMDSTTADIDLETINGTEWDGDNATARLPCPKVRVDDESLPCPKQCLEEANARMPSQDDLLRVPEKMKDLLRKKCWETTFGQELVKLTVMDLVMTVISTIITDFLRAVFVRYANNCWCWDLEKGFPGYGDFKIAENILHLVNNQGLVWMGMFFSPGLPAINTVKLCILVYVRSWAVLTANIPHETVFRASRSNNFYYTLLLIMLFLCTLPVGFACVWLQPSWHCGPFSQQKRIYNVFTSYIIGILPPMLRSVARYLTSPGAVIPLLLLLILVIYYLVSLRSSLREANNDLKMQLRREKSEREKPAKEPEKPPDTTVELPIAPAEVSKWSPAKKIIPLNKFKSPVQLLVDDDTDDSQDTPTKKKSKKGRTSSGHASEDHFEGREDKKAHREDMKGRMGRHGPSPLSTTESSSGEGERRWMRRGGITGNGDLPLITISRASEGRDSPTPSLPTSEEGTPTSRRPIPSVSEQEEDEYLEDTTMTVEIQDFEPIRDHEEIDMKPETTKPRDTAEIKALTGCSTYRLRYAEDSSFTDPEYEEYCNKGTLPMETCDKVRKVIRNGKSNSRSARHSSFQRSKAVKGSDSSGSADFKLDTQVRRAKIQRLDTDSL